MNIGLYFENIDDLIRIIKFLDNENIKVSIDYNMERPPQHAQDAYKKRFFDNLIKNRKNLEIVINNMCPSFDSIFNYILHNYILDKYLPNINLIIERALNSGYVPRLNIMGDEFRLLLLYNTTQNKRLLQFILDNLDIFDPKDLTSKIFINTLLQNVDRETFSNLLINDEEFIKADYLKRYDDAVKKRITDISLGLGYAQMDNQDQSTIPSLVLQEIVNQSVDFSGMPAQDVYKLIKHINEGTTNKTVRLGQPSNFADAQDELDDSHEDVIEI